MRDLTLKLHGNIHAVESMAPQLIELLAPYCTSIGHTEKSSAGDVELNITGLLDDVDFTDATAPSFLICTECGAPQ